MHVSKLSILAASLLAGLCSSAATPVEQTAYGLTHEEYLEFLTLNSTEGWEPMARVQMYTATDGETIDFGQGLEKRGGDNQFIAWGNEGCGGPARFRAQHFGCGLCVSTGSYSAISTFQSGYLWRFEISGKYPTAYWFSDAKCGGQIVHKQGIWGGQASSCDSASVWDVTTLPQSVMLYQGC